MADFDPKKLAETLNKARLSVDSALTDLRVSGALGDEAMSEEFAKTAGGNSSCVINTGCHKATAEQ
ncbi:hypothetical protein ABTY61_38745 [Kitasatospora sp. NPDC096128]|uniref:hypothetical protein n=1 Tax=Kitasatospora sp. NPDC096128 TaxID=3155547 RepID=UPI0033347AA9